MSTCGYCGQYQADTMLDWPLGGECRDTGVAPPPHVCPPPRNFEAALQHVGWCRATGMPVTSREKARTRVALILGPDTTTVLTPELLQAWRQARTAVGLPHLESENPARPDGLLVTPEVTTRYDDLLERHGLPRLYSPSPHGILGAVT